MVLPRLYPIVDIGSLEARGLALEPFVRELLEGGAEILQLRDKRSMPQQVLQHAEVISRALEGNSCLTVMNDRVDLALLAGWHAVHLGHKDLGPEIAKGLLGGEKAIVGVSTHNALQLAEADTGPADYVAIGPVFSTTTKTDTEPVVGLEGVRQARALTRKPLVAIGGITLENAASVVAAGADSVAVIGGLMEPGKGVTATVRDFLRLLR